MTDARKTTEDLGGKWYGHYGLCHCPAHANTDTPALTVTNADDGKFLAHCHAGCSFEEVMAGLGERGLFNGHSDSSIKNCDTGNKSVNLSSLDYRQKRARNLWNSAYDLKGTPAEQYLLSRCIECHDIHNLRYAPICEHLSGELLAALVARIEGSEGSAVHLTYIDEMGEKADVEPQKVMLGPTKGGAVRLMKGEDGLIVAEGIETCLSIQSGISPPPFSVWAALSASNMRSLILPPSPSKLIIAPDGDTTGRQAAHELAVRAHALGWQVLVTNTPDGMDWNDVLQEGKSWS
ncbi:DUF7146 domain-containing protein [Ruegeria arenilitoris]|uniref:DUF7146 domain-containing protein n=1 Tax=Ruegeria arenilitoris TaxID=1173585 RepID=UPI00147C2BA3|nr:toprim domain-containing protein [Ruegeria arenilitoris]